MKIITKTERLIIREILPTDIDEMFELHSDPEVHLYLGNKTITTKEKAFASLDYAFDLTIRRVSAALYGFIMKSSVSDTV